MTCKSPSIYTNAIYKKKGSLFVKVNLRDELKNKN